MVDKDHYNFDGLCIAPDKYHRTKCSLSALENVDDSDEVECIYFDVDCGLKCLKKLDDKESED